MAHTHGNKNFGYLSGAEQAAAHAYKGYVQKPLSNDGLQGKSQFAGQHPEPHQNPHLAGSFKTKKRNKKVTSRAY